MVVSLAQEGGGGMKRRGAVASEDEARGGDGRWEMGDGREGATGVGRQRGTRTRVVRQLGCIIFSGPWTVYYRRVFIRTCLSQNISNTDARSRNYRRGF